MLRLDGRLVAALVVAVYLLALGGIDLGSGATPWMKVGVNARATKFEDMSSITSAWVCRRRGIEPFPSNPCDPSGRPANYPRLVTRLDLLGLGTADTTKLGVGLAVLFFLAALGVTGRLSAGEGLVYGAALIAPATMLGVERGNIDLLMFALVALGVVLVGRSAWAGAAPIVLAAILKLFPALALVVLARRRKRWRALAASLAVLAVYAALTFSDLRTIERVIPRDVSNSYGADVLARAVSPAHEGPLKAVVPLAGLLLGAVLVGLARGGRDPRADERRLDAFWAGAGVYLGTYVFGNNFDYRLVFLLLCVPQLCTWVRAGGAPAPWPAAALGALLATLWLSSLYPPLPFGLQTWDLGLRVPPEEVLNWLLFAWLAAALASGAGLQLPQLRREQGEHNYQAAVPHE